MAAFIDRTGNRHGKLTVLSPVPNSRGPNYAPDRWLCRCDCGREHVVRTVNLETTQSCGCLSKLHGKPLLQTPINSTR